MVRQELLSSADKTKNAVKKSTYHLARYVPRPAISIPILWAPPEIADPSANIDTNVRRTGFLPNTETMPPTRGSIAVDAIVYALPAKIKSSPCKCWTIVGSAVDTVVLQEFYV